MFPTQLDEGTNGTNTHTGDTNSNSDEGSYLSTWSNLPAATFLDNLLCFWHRYWFNSVLDFFVLNISNSP